MANPNSYPDRNQYPDRNRPQSPEYNHSEYNHSEQNDRSYNHSDDSMPLDDRTINTRLATSDEIAYREGYTYGRNQEQFREQVNQKRENDSAANGVAIGVLLATLAGMVLAMTYFGTRSQQIDQTPVPVPPQTQSSPTPTQSPAQTTIIERQPQVIPVPQQTEIIVPSPSQSNSTQPSTSQPNTSQPSNSQPSNSQPSTIQPNPAQSDTTTQPNSNQPDSTLVQPGTSGMSPSQTSPDASNGTGSVQ